MPPMRSLPVDAVYEEAEVIEFAFGARCDDTQSIGA